MLKGLVFHGGPSLERRRRREIEKAYRDKDARLQAIWLIRLGDSNPVDPRRCRGIVYPTAFVVYQTKKRGPRLSSGKSDVRYIGAMPGRLGFFGKSSVELRKGGFLSYTRSTICVLACYSHRIFSASSCRFPPPPPRFPCFVPFFILFFVSILPPFDRIVNFLRQLLWNMLRNHDTICPIATRLIADPCHIPFIGRSLPCKHT